MNELLNLIFRWLHVVPAIAMVGGLIFLRLCIVKPDQDKSLLDAMDTVRTSWARLVMASTLLLLVSGLYNAYIKATTLELSPVYNGLLGIKILLALAVFFFAALLSGRSERAQRFRESEAKWLNITLVMSLAIVLIAGYMKMAGAGFPLK